MFATKFAFSLLPSSPGPFPPPLGRDLGSKLVSGGFFAIEFVYEQPSYHYSGRSGAFSATELVSGGLFVSKLVYEQPSSH